MVGELSNRSSISFNIYLISLTGFGLELAGKQDILSPIASLLTLPRSLVPPRSVPFVYTLSASARQQNCLFSASPAPPLGIPLQVSQRLALPGSSFSCLFPDGSTDLGWSCLFILSGWGSIAIAIGPPISIYFIDNWERGEAKDAYTGQGLTKVAADNSR